jgi:hypothetical protein
VPFLRENIKAGGSRPAGINSDRRYRDAADFKGGGPRYPTRETADTKNASAPTGKERAAELENNCALRGFQDFNESRQVEGYDLPEDVKIDLIVAVDQTVPQAHDLRPGNLREARAFFLGDAVCRFANNLKLADES